MPTWRPDPTFYPSPALAMEAPAEGLAYVAMLNASGNGGRDAIGVVDVDPASPTYSRLVGKVEFPQGDNELHHFGWNACSSHLCPFAPHPHRCELHAFQPKWCSSLPPLGKSRRPTIRP